MTQKKELHEVKFTVTLGHDNYAKLARAKVMVRELGGYGVSRSDVLDAIVTAADISAIVQQLTVPKRVETVS